MQEEVTQKTIAISIQSTKMTAAVLQKALTKLLASQKKKSAQLHKGKQTMRQLMKHNTGVSNIEITQDNIKTFEHTAKKYGIDFALKKDVSAQPPRYLVFFKGRDADVLTAAFKEFSAKNLDRDKKPSIRKLLSQAQEKARQQRQREKVKTKERGQEL
ncbi:MAG TPA: PcfB family protein [Sedimentibacter sp.]|nr:PcfB family protein [Sedimentibacter sp.]